MCLPIFDINNKILRGIRMSFWLNVKKPQKCPPLRNFNRLMVPKTKEQKLKTNGFRNSKNFNVSLLRLTYTGHRTETPEGARNQEPKVFWGQNVSARSVYQYLTEIIKF